MYNLVMLLVNVLTPTDLHASPVPQEKDKSEAMRDADCWTDPVGHAWAGLFNQQNVPLGIM